MAKKEDKKEEKDFTPVATNREASYNYEILDRYEAGIELKGSEVKSIREGRANLRDSFIRFKGNEAFVMNLHISPYSHVSFSAPEPDRMRKLLLKKAEIIRLATEVTRKGFTCVPLKLYFKRGWAKLLIAVCRGKKKYDRREAIKKRIHEREVDREVKSKMRKKSSGG